MNDLQVRPPNAEGAKLIVAEQVAFQFLVVPLDKDGQTLRVAAANGYEESMMQTLGSMLRHRIEVIETRSPHQIREDLRSLYRPEQHREDFARPVDKSTKDRFVSILARAVDMHASDVHLEPTEKGGRVRFRADMRLIAVQDLDFADYDSLVSLVKLDSKLKLDQKRIMQEGAVFENIGPGRDIECRVSLVPDGRRESARETVVIRLLGASATLMRIEDLGMPAELLESLKRALVTPEGVFCASGPTGAGKSTSVLTWLSGLSGDRKVCTIEDPIEVRLANAIQVELNEAQDITFARAMKAFLRQDPDAILCGETRDPETAQQAMNMGLAGRLVFTTLHARDAIRTVQRWVEFGVARSTISQSLKFVISQRAVRLLCEHCKVVKSKIPLEFRTYYRQWLETVDRVSVHERHPQGCKFCGFTGIRGRSAIFEGFSMTDEIEEAIVLEASRAALQLLAQEDGGYVPMRHHAAALVAEGRVSLEDAQEAVQMFP